MPQAEARFHFRNQWVPALLCAALAAAPAVPASAPRPEALIKWRQSAFQVIAWNAARIKAALEGDYDRTEVRSASEALAAVASAGLADLFAPGTASGKGWRETTARGAVFHDATKFRELSDQFAIEARELARLAAVGERGAVGTQFARVAQRCKACHQQYRDTD